MLPHFAVCITLDCTGGKVDTEIQDVVESAYRMEREHGFLELGAMRSDATFTALIRLDQTRSPAVLDGCPDWLVQQLREWAKTFQEHGSFGYVSNLGEADHSELMGRVAPLVLGDLLSP
jgi:hypothetical protein